MSRYCCASRSPKRAVGNNKVFSLAKLLCGGCGLLPPLIMVIAQALAACGLWPDDMGVNFRSRIIRARPRRIFIFLSETGIRPTKGVPKRRELDKMKIKRTKGGNRLIIWFRSKFSRYSESGFKLFPPCFTWVATYVN